MVPSVVAEAGLHEVPLADLLALFDRLEPVEVAFLRGRWRGQELRTGHPFEGLLEAAGWFGKEFIDADTVHPLLVRAAGGEVFPVAPSPLALRLLRSMPRLRGPAGRPLLRCLARLLRTRSPQARLRMVEIRGRVSAAMLYDRLPVLDSFRRLDADTVLGLMDEKGQPRPYLFLLRREPAGTLSTGAGGG